MVDHVDTGRHTPGPWQADTENPWPPQVGCCPLVGRPYSIAKGSINVAAASRAEDAVLVAAAPDMLAALQTILSMSLMDKGHWAKTIEQEAHAAILKATGGQP